MKRTLSLLLIASAIALPTASAFAVPAQSAPTGITRLQVRQELYRSFLTGTMANDEMYTYPSPPANRAEIQAFRCNEARAHLSHSEFPSIVKSVCTG
ncbi:DUF4148 domain-containing protein [Paraburkholderia metrosideri]|uniref:DUF4148 domain-containing protein n=1 Tax=Paraburkholderia metrosideri TaxID=580937 RepID=A0ABN7HIE5_9BURK|nr:DUF4148 domain-containing protein [Paraburkholderia metrosideri]CAD6517371.1 hypothetical protein LMG28140_00928 [Paraburkholderia metrosideri]